jgi:hypothetical protein
LKTTATHFETMNRFSEFLRALSPDCRAATRLQSDALDRDLSSLQRLGLRIHLALCVWCRRYGKQLRFLRKVAHHCDEHPAKTASPGLSPAARERIKQALKSAEK